MLLSDRQYLKVHLDYTSGCFLFTAYERMPTGKDCGVMHSLPIGAVRFSSNRAAYLDLFLRLMLMELESKVRASSVTGG